MPIPTLSAIRGWDSEHLTDAAGHWTRTAMVWEENFTALATRIAYPGGTLWEGRSAESAHRRTHADRMVVIALADQLHSASLIARSGATEISRARLAVLRVVRAAEAAGFLVGDDFSVTDPHFYPAATAGGRHSQAVGFAGELRSTVGMLVAADKDVAVKLTAATAGLREAAFPESGGAAVDFADPHATLRRIEDSNRKLLDELEQQYRQLPEGQIKTDRLADIAGIRKSMTTPDSHLIYLARPEDPSQMVPAAVAVGDPYAAEHISVTVPGVGSASRKSLSAMTQEAGELVREAREIAAVTGLSDSVSAIAYMGYQPPLTMTSAEIFDDDLAQVGAVELRSFLSALNATAKPGHTTALFGHSYGSLTSGIALKDGGGAMVDNVVLYGSPGFGATTAAQLGLRDEQLFVMTAPDDPIANQIGALAPLHGWGADPNTVVGHRYLFTHLETQATTVHGTDSLGRAVEWEKTAARGHSEYGRAATERITGFNLAAILLDEPDLAVKAHPSYADYSLISR